MCGIAENRLVEISNLDFDIAFFACKRAKIAKMAVTANPDSGALGYFEFGLKEPSVEVRSTPTHVTVGVTRHLDLAQGS
jgi:hypothetical protein